VVLRLKTLETLHHEVCVLELTMALLILAIPQAASFHVRLGEATETLARLSTEVDSNTETLASLKTVSSHHLSKGSDERC
jgi:hypothetical protein